MTSRRLAAIVVVDVAGYSRMMAEDEEGTLAALKAHRNETDPIVLNHGGRIVKGTGDGLLIEFPSAVEAVHAGVEAQRLMAERNAALPPDRRMEYRIGVNLGDVIVDDDGDIYGDGVNIAARLEAHADVGGICVSDAVHRQVAGKLGVDFEDLGALEVKDLPEPIRAWRVAMDGITATPESVAASRYALPSAAVLPFVNMSRDAEEEYFADGLTEDLITDLSRYRDIKVVSRNSTFAFKGRASDIRRTARELDATFVVEGSTRRAADRVRITAQLVEAESGHHVWADRYDRELDDIFAVQDEIVHEIAARVHPHIERATGEQLGKASSASLGAWEMVQRGKWQAYQGTFESTAEAIRLFEIASQRDPDMTEAHAWRAMAWVNVAYNRWRIDDRNPWDEMKASAERAYESDPTDPQAIAAMAYARHAEGALQAAVDLARRGLSMTPDDPMLLNVAGQLHYFMGDPDGGIDQLSQAWRQAGYEPWRYHIANNLAFSHYLARRFEAALAWAQRALEVNDYLQTRAIAAAALGQLGRIDEASHHIGFIIASRPGTTASDFVRNVIWRDPSHIELYRDGLVKAGLPR